MPTAIFLRAVNVGGTKVFRPAQLVKPLAHLGLVNIGAAGTFVVKERLSDTAIRAELMEHLPEGAEAFFAKGSEVAALVAKPPFPAKPFPDEHSRYITIFAKAPGTVKLPRDYPPGKDWECRVYAVQGRFLSSIRRMHSDPGTFPLKQLEKEFGARGTTRNWNTIVKVAAALSHRAMI